eukprot:1139324-Pelagomonas_calceolata.AAC.6
MAKRIGLSSTMAQVTLLMIEQKAKAHCPSNFPREFYLSPLASMQLGWHEERSPLNAATCVPGAGSILKTSTGQLAAPKKCLKSNYPACQHHLILGPSCNLRQVAMLENACCSHPSCCCAKSNTLKASYLSSTETATGMEQ